jgi:hypothetical protein
MPSLDVTENPPDPPTVESMHLAVSLEAPRELGYGQSYMAGLERVWREPVGGGIVDVLVVDADNYALLEAGEPFEAARMEPGTGSVALELPLDPGGPDLYVVAANADRVVHAQEISVELSTFWPEPEAEAEEPVPEASDADVDGDVEGDGGIAAGGGGGCGCAIAS